MEDTKILRAVIDSRSAYDKIAAHVETKDFTAPVQFWWRLVDEYYKRDAGAVSVDLGTLRSLGDSRITNPKHRDTTLGVLADLPTGVSASNVVAAVLELKRYNAVAEFASAVMSRTAGAKAAKLLQHVNELFDMDTLAAAGEERKYAVDVELLYDSVGSDKRIALLPKMLTERTGGGCLPGHHILVFGRTEVGKSTFVINMAAGLVRAGQRVLYVGNEDEINNVKARFVCRLTRQTPAECERDRDATSQLFRKRGGETRLRLLHLQPGAVSSLRKDIEEFSPTVVVVDQIRNLSGPEDGMTQRMEANAIKFRSLINEYNLVGISVTQAGNRDDRHNADGPIWLGAGDVDSSRVGLPAQVDLMLGIGANAEMLSRGQRAISIAKNKLHSSPTSREGFIANFDLLRSIVTT